MWVSRCAAVFALATVITRPGTALGFVGVPGCINLPEYQRAVGALQGMTGPCDMSVEEACRVAAARGVSAAACQPTAPRSRRPRTRSPHR